HGSLKAVEPAQPGRVKCRLLVCTGADDPFVSRDERGAFEDEMTRAGADWQLIVYSGARHGFTNRNVDPSRSPGSAYHEPTDRRSWQAMRTLFQETMGAV
ncbi:MAG: dienelactone hydrolase family protein, partial [Bradyrhizobiaceae bacterium]|nr:dienelactone hydrolase family protein [Bradyrhizobiaceae bacterium]